MKCFASAKMKTAPTLVYSVGAVTELRNCGSACTRFPSLVDIEIARSAPRKPKLYDYYSALTSTFFASPFKPAASRNKATLSVASHVNSGSSRPKWP